MIMRKVDAFNDWTFGKGVSNYVKDDAAIQQNVRARILSWKGDCFFDIQAGVDWRGRLDIGQTEALKSEIKSVITQSYGVVKASDVVVNLAQRTRRISISYDVTTIFSRSFKTTIGRASGAGDDNA